MQHDRTSEKALTNLAEIKTGRKVTFPKLAHLPRHWDAIPRRNLGRRVRQAMPNHPGTVRAVRHRPPVRHRGVRRHQAYVRAGDGQRS